MLLLIFALLSGSLGAQTYQVSPYGAKVVSLSEGGRAFISGYDSIMVNPAGTGLVEDPQFGLGIGIGNYLSMSIGYVDEGGFHIQQSFKDIDSGVTVAGAQTYVGFSYALSKFWILGFNGGYNYFQEHNGWDINFGLDFGPGLKSATRSGFIGAIALRSPFEHGGVGEVSASLGYSYRATFNITLDNIYVFGEDTIVGTHVVNGDRYDMVLALESFPLETEDFSMTFSGRVESVGGDNRLKFGVGFGYVGETFKFDTGLFASDFSNGKIKQATFAISLIFGV